MAPDEEIPDSFIRIVALVAAAVTMIGRPGDSGVLPQDVAIDRAKRFAAYIKGKGSK